MFIESKVINIGKKRKNTLDYVPNELNENVIRQNKKVKVDVAQYD